MVKNEIKKLVEKAIKELDWEVPEFSVGQSRTKEHGDYTTNVAMVIAKLVKENPMEISKLIIENCKWRIEKIFEKVEVAKPGFINFFLSKDVLVNELERILKEKEKYGSSKIGKGKTVIIDYSSPNIAKPFGIGHLRSTIIGQALYNIYKFLGFKCIGDNHLGDWGTQFGKLIVAIKKWGKEVENFSIEDLEKLYVKFHQEAESNPQLKEEARTEFKKLEEGDKEAKRIWKICVEISLKEFERIYKLLGIEIDYAFGESFYEPTLKEIIGEAKAKKVAIESQGAIIIRYPKNELPPAMILKSDGTTTYLTRDLATIKYRLKRWKPDLIVYEVGADQSLHFQQLFRSVELLNWAKKEKFFHIAHGLIRTKMGKFSTRRGETVHLEEVLKEAIEKAREIIEKSETGRGLSQKEKEKIAKLVGIGGVKYNDLSQHYSRDIVFDWGKILNLKGNSAPYLQYTYVRCQSVLRKARFRGLQKINYRDFNREEMEVLHRIYQFPEVIEEAAKRFSPNLICEFIFDLSQKYNLFYDLHPIIKAKNSNQRVFRLSLTKTVSQILKNTLDLMGISAPEKM